MRKSRSTATSQTPRTPEPRRRAQRHVTESLSCDLGRVLDLSTHGMKVACSGKPKLQIGQTGKVRLQIPEGSLAVLGRAVWIRRSGFRRYELGLEFLNVKRSMRMALDSIARFGFLGTGNDTSEHTGEGERRKTANTTVHATIDLPDYYAILGVGERATEDEIRNAFRSLARQYHPDVTKDPNGQERFIQLHEAYEFLKDPDRRKSYDHLKAG